METLVLAQEALGMYGMSGASLHFLRHNENAVYRVEDTDGKRYVLRLHISAPNLAFDASPRREDWLHAEMAFVQALAAGPGIVVQTPAQTRDGRLVATLADHAVLATMLSWLPGEPLDPRSPNAPAQAGAVGRLAASLHAFALANPWLNTLARPRYDAARMREVAERIRPGEDDGLFSPAACRTLADACDAVGACFAQAFSDPGKFGLIHADLGLGNLLVRPDGMVSPIDFGLCGHAPLLFDIGGLMGTYNDPALRRAALDGYRQDRPQQVEDARLMEAGFLASIFLFMAMHLRNDHVRAWFSGRLPVVLAEHVEPFLRGDAFLPELLRDA